MGESVLYRDYLNDHRAHLREVFKEFRITIVLQFAVAILLVSLTIMLRNNGYAAEEDLLRKSGGLCGIPLFEWFLAFSTILVVRLLFTIARY